MRAAMCADVADLEAFVAGRLLTTGPVDAAFAAAACWRVGTLDELDRELRHPHDRRRGCAPISRTLGRQLLRPAERAWPSDRYATLRARASPTGRCSRSRSASWRGAAGLDADRRRAVLAAPSRRRDHHRGACACSASIRSTSHALAARLGHAARRACRGGRRARGRHARAARPAGDDQPARRHPRRASRHLGGEALCLLIINPANRIIRATATPTVITTDCPTTRCRPSGDARAAVRCGSASADRSAAARPPSSPRCAGCWHRPVSIVVVTNDIFTTEDAEALRRMAVLADDRIVPVETGACPHTAIRDDISANLDAVEQLEAAQRAGRADPGRERRRQPHRDLQSRARRPADLRDRRRRRRQGAAQGWTGRDDRRPAGDQQDRSRAVRARRSRRDGPRRQGRAAATCRSRSPRSSSRAAPTSWPTGCARSWPRWQSRTLGAERRRRDRRRRPRSTSGSTPGVTPSCDACAARCRCWCASSSRTAPTLTLAMVNGAAGPLGGDRLRFRLQLSAPGRRVDRPFGRRRDGAARARR